MVRGRRVGCCGGGGQLAGQLCPTLVAWELELVLLFAAGSSRLTLPLCGGPAHAARPALQEDEDDGPLGMSAADLAGAKVKHSAEDLEEGETMILTLEDKSILDEKGRLREEEDPVLENILAVGGCWVPTLGCRSGWVHGLQAAGGRGMLNCQPSLVAGAP